jgi:hypothetical protein
VCVHACDVQPRDSRRCVWQHMKVDTSQHGLVISQPLFTPKRLQVRRPLARFAVSNRA